MRTHQHEGLGCQVCRLPATADGVHVTPPPWPHRAHPAWATVGWTTRGLAVFATIPQPDPTGEPDGGPDGGPDGESDGYDMVLGRWWDVPRLPSGPPD